MTQPDAVRLRHMLEAAEKCVDLWRDKLYGDVLRDETAALATIRLLEVVGEAAKHVSTEMRGSHPEISWREIAGTRDRLIHGYFDVDYEVIWSIITIDLPVLVRQLERILGNDPAGAGEL
ncbi:MAG: HepT-like ribonuclease domain-containing protein [Anaerolineae bacterium]